MQRVLVIGSTGAVGREVVAQLAARGTHQVRALVRNPEGASFPSFVEIVRGDLTVPDSLHPCLEDIDAVFLLWTAPPASVAAAVELITRHAKCVVFLSSPHKTAHPFFQQPNRMRDVHIDIEQRIERANVDWTFVRPGMFARNCIGWWAPQIRAGLGIRWPHLDVPTAPIDERDIAAVAVRALCGEGHAGAEYVVTGPQSLTQREQLSAIGAVLGRELDIEEISPEQTRVELSTTWPPAAIDMLLNAWCAAAGQSAFVTNTVYVVTGTPPRTFRDWVIHHADEFSSTRSNTVHRAHS